MALIFFDLKYFFRIIFKELKSEFLTFIFKSLPKFSQSILPSLKFLSLVFSEIKLNLLKPLRVIKYLLSSVSSNFTILPAQPTLKNVSFSSVSFKFWGCIIPINLFLF